MSQVGEIETVAVVGLGLMGSGIAQVAAAAGCRVLVHDAAPAALDKGLGRIRGSLEKLVAKGAISAAAQDAAWRRIEPAAGLEGLDAADLVVEAIIEDLEQKKRLFGALGAATPARTILATNTSSFPIAEIAAASGRPGRTMGLHFFNPVQLMKLVEIVRCASTDDQAARAVRRFIERIGKTPIEARDTPGFVVNRLLVPYLGEAIRMLERGDATREDIDTGMALGCGHPMGPLTLLDYVGLDTTLFILEGWHARFPENPLFEPPALLRKMVEEGRLGRKTGSGFYRWEGDKKA